MERNNDIVAHIDKIFADMCNEYEAVLGVFYPGQESAGFNESNLVQKFMYHYKQVVSEVVVWSELSTGRIEVGSTDDDELKKLPGRLDGVIVDFENDALIIIEAKRFNKKNKIESSVNDIIRSVKLKDDVFHIKNSFPKHRYTLVLGDIWAEGSSTDIRRRWIAEWETNNPLVAHLRFDAKATVLGHKCYNVAKYSTYHIVYSLFDIIKENEQDH